MLGILPSNKVGREKGAFLPVRDSYNCREAVCDSYNCREAVCDSYNCREAVRNSSLSMKNLFFFKKKKVRIGTYILPLGHCNILR